jgi:methylglutaconyl-CoA hydratase
MHKPLVFLEQVSPYLAIISLNRPEKRNALSIAMLEELCRLLEALQKDPHLRVVILRGEGPVFCAGLDLEETANPARADHSAHLLASLFENLALSPLITIAAIQGAAMAGGGGLVAAADFSIIADNAKIGFPEVHKGIIPAFVTVLLQRKIAQRDIKELLLFGEILQPAKAIEIGLVNRIAQPEGLMTEAMRYASLALKAAPNALRQTKQFIHSFDSSHVHANFKDALVLHQQGRHSSEALEGITAYLEKREPNWYAQ